MPGDDKQRRATIHDVARAAGVSAATVSKVLRGVRSVREDNADRVREAVAALDYRMDPVASGLRGEQRRIIGAVVPDLESAFFGKLVTGLERAAEEAGYHMIVASSRESEAREADRRSAGRCCRPGRSYSTFLFPLYWNALQKKGPGDKRPGPGERRWGFGTTRPLLRRGPSSTSAWRTRRRPRALPRVPPHARCCGTGLRRNRAALWSPKPGAG